MKNFSLSIYGNLIYDQILYLKNFPKQGVAEKVDKINYRVGASANVARAYFHITKTKPIIVSNISLDENYERIIEEVSRYSLPSFTKVEGKNSSAMILSNLSNSSRTGLVYWGSCLNLSNFLDQESSWNHFSYLDKLVNLNANQLKKIKGTKSADFTSFDYNDLQKKRILECVEEINYIISSKEECSYLFPKLNLREMVLAIGKKCKDFAIIHDENGSYISDGNFIEYLDSGHDVIEDIFVLGAGDAFAAAFIASFENKKSIKDIVLESHRKTFDFLRFHNEKI